MYGHQNPSSANEILLQSIRYTTHTHTHTHTRAHTHSHAHIMR